MHADRAARCGPVFMRYTHHPDMDANLLAGRDFVDDADGALWSR